VRENAPQAVIFVGVQAAGKSTYFARHYAATHVRLSLDMLRTRHREKVLLHACLAIDQSFVVDNTNPRACVRAGYVRAAKAAGFEVEAVVFEVSLELALARNARREGKARVPDRAIHGTLAKLEPVREDEGFDRITMIRAGEDHDEGVEDEGVERDEDRDDD
jgi:predicted kinase